MTKKIKFTIPEITSKEILNSLSVKNISLISNNEESFLFLKKNFFLEEDELINVTQGTGPLAYKGQGTKNGNKICAILAQNNKKSFLVKANTSESFDFLNMLVKGESQNLINFKVSSSEAILCVPLEQDHNDLLDQSLENNRILKTKKLKMSLTKDKILEFGTSSSVKYIRFGISTYQNSSLKKEKCLYGIIKVKEIEPKFLKILNASNLNLEHIHLLALRETMEILNDCDLKDIVLNFLKNNYFIPSEKNLKTKVLSENSKVKYLKNAFQATLVYLENPLLKPLVQPVVNEFLENLKVKNFSNEKLEKEEPKKK